MTRAEARIRHAKDPNSGLPLLTLERLTYRFVGAGYVLLSATLLAGFLFGDALYGHGHAWRWDHKTIFSMLAWLTFSVSADRTISVRLARKKSCQRSVRRINLPVACLCRITLCHGSHSGALRMGFLVGIGRSLGGWRWRAWRESRLAVKTKAHLAQSAKSMVPVAFAEFTFLPAMQRRVPWAVLQHGTPCPDGRLNDHPADEHAIVVLSRGAGHHSGRGRYFV